MDHDELVEHVRKYFVEHEAIWMSEEMANLGPKQVDTSVAQYTGGLVKVSDDTYDDDMTHFEMYKSMFQ